MAEEPSAKKMEKAVQLLTQIEKAVETANCAEEITLIMSFFRFVISACMLLVILVYSPISF